MIYLISITATMPSPAPSFKKGQSLIGILVAMAIFSILAQAIFTVVGASFNFVSFNRARVTGLHLAQEKIEFIRNLPFDNVGTTGGIPSGPLPQSENVTRNNLNYVVKISVVYIDDDFDDTAPSDLLPTDYKRVRVEVSWEGLAESRRNPVVLLTDIAPKDIETTTGGGTLSIVVFDSSGNPVSQANVAITAATSPAVNLSLQTGSNGRVLLPGAPTCISCYQITVTKAGFSGERTYSTAEVANPNKPHQTIIEGQISEVSFAIDRVSSLAIASKNDKENNFSTLPSVSFNMRGDKTIGTDTSSQPVYKYEENLVTDASGNLTINDVEWDNYQITRDSGGSYDISASNPIIPLSVIPNTNLNLALAFTAHTTNNLLISFIDTSSTPIASISATLSAGGGFESTKISGELGNPDYGQVFFANLVSQNYSILATASGYLNYTGNINVSGQTSEQIIMTPQ